MSTFAILLTAPLLLALILWMLAPRWQRAASVAAFLAALLLALLAAGLELQPETPAISLFSSEAGLLLGGAGIFTEGMRQIFILLYAAAAILFLTCMRWPQGPNFVPAGLASLSPLLFAMVVDRLAFGAAAVLLAIGLLATMAADGEDRAGLAAWRFFLLSALALPLLLLAGWMLESQQLALGEAAWRILFLGAAALLAGFPFHIWVRRLVAEGPALAALFIVGPAQLAILTFLWRWLAQYSEYLGSTPISAALGWVGAVTVLIGAVQAFRAQNPRSLLGSLVVADMGAVVICLGVQGITQTWALILFRLPSLLVALAALRWLDGHSMTDERAERAWPGRHPLAAGLFAYGALALAGAPLTVGFAARWAAVSAGSAGSVWWGFVQVLAVAAGVAGVLRNLAPIAADAGRQLQAQGTPSTTQRRLQVTALALGLLVVLYISFSPWPFLRLVSAIGAQF